MTNPIHTYIIDIDGTLSDPTHRRKYIDGSMGTKDWDAFHAECGLDPPRRPITRVIRQLVKYSNSGGIDVLFVTGRMERCRADTVKWLMNEVCFWGARSEPYLQHTLYMRADGDFRDDVIIKEEILDKIIVGGKHHPVMAFDDRPRVIAMWRRRGLTVADVGDGVDF